MRHPKHTPHPGGKPRSPAAGGEEPGESSESVGEVVVGVAVIAGGEPSLPPLEKSSSAESLASCMSSSESIAAPPPPALASARRRSLRSSADRADRSGAHHEEGAIGPGARGRGGARAGSRQRREGRGGCAGVGRAGEGRNGRTDWWKWWVGWIRLLPTEENSWRNASFSSRFLTLSPPLCFQLFIHYYHSSLCA
ncbi:hypothetical protein ZWY2020_025876 [Hordeum vulgare]|nr:hypothetical protein ZWY2020_025876 [Hordeum vulgare]